MPPGDGKYRETMAVGQLVTAPIALVRNQQPARRSSLDAVVELNDLILEEGLR